jgi:hypothetical protein
MNFGGPPRAGARIKARSPNAARFGEDTLFPVTQVIMFPEPNYRLKQQ